MIRSSLLTTGLAVFALSWLQPHPATAQNATLLRDVNTDPFARPPFQDADFRDLQVAGGKLYFWADSQGAGSEIWVSDGTSAGTEQLRDGCPGSCSHTANFFGALGDLMLWSEDAGDSGGAQLWRTDGTRPGTFALTTAPLDLRPHLSEPDGATAVSGGAFYFQSCAFEPATGNDCDLWRTEGTVATTRLFHAEPRRFGWLKGAANRLYYLVQDGAAWELWTVQRGQLAPLRLHRFATVREPHAPVLAGGRLFFLARDDGSEEVWSSDGTVAGTRAATQFTPVSPFPEWLKAAGNRVYFTADDGRNGPELWSTDGTPSGMVRLTNFSSATPFDTVNSNFLSVLGDRVVFFAGNDESTVRLWTSRGTLQSTVPLALDCEGCVPEFSRTLIEAGGKAFFLMYTGFLFDLWVTDGTPAGSRSLLPACANFGCDFESIAPWMNGILFPFDRGGSSQTIWFSDGTAAGTRPFLSLDRDDAIGEPPRVVELGGRAYYLVEGQYSSALWVREANGTARPVRRVTESRSSSFPQPLFGLGDRLLFVAHQDDFAGGDLWTSRGTAETTFQLDLPDLSFEHTPTFVRSGNLAYFRTGDSFQPMNLWRSDGTPEGTFVVAHLRDEVPMGTLGGGVVFFDGGWIWRTDGTVAGTVKTGDVPAEISVVRQMMEGPNGLYFDAETSLFVRELWITDGTTAGTRTLASFGRAGSPINGAELTPLGSRVYFVAPRGIWRTDGTVAGTEEVVPLGLDETIFGLRAFQGSLYFFRDHLSQPSALELWKTDGTPAGAVRLGSFRAREIGQLLPGLTPLGGRLYFVADDGVHGLELWATDGTAAGTVLVRDIVPGRLGWKPSGLAAAGSVLYFSAGDTAHGVKLWRSDGTEAGTRLAQDIAPQAGSSSPSGLTVAGDKLYFAANDGLFGREPWVLPLSGATGCQATSTRLCLGSGRYAVDSTWRDHQGNEGVGHPVALTADTGYFWFFAPSNVEAVLKVLDGRGVNGHVWTFYGALSDVEYSLTVTDTETGLSHRYLNPPGQLASVADTNSFGPLGASAASVTTVASGSKPGAALALVERRVMARAATGVCAPGSNRLCLNGGRYAVEVAWKDFAGNTGTGQGVGLTADTGYFWFFNPENVELVLKVLDGSAVNGHRWVFYGALSSVEYAVTVTDTQTGEIKTYRNPSGNLASVADTEAF